MGAASRLADVGDLIIAAVASVACNGLAMGLIALGPSREADTGCHCLPLASVPR